MKYNEGNWETITSFFFGIYMYMLFKWTLHSGSVRVAYICNWNYNNRMCYPIRILFYCWSCYNYHFIFNSDLTVKSEQTTISFILSYLLLWISFTLAMPKDECACLHAMRLCESCTCSHHYRQPSGIIVYLDFCQMRLEWSKYWCSSFSLYSLAVMYCVAHFY